jgi:hypothetical protein
MIQKRAKRTIFTVPRQLPSVQKLGPLFKFVLSKIKDAKIIKNNDGVSILQSSIRRLSREHGWAVEDLEIRL